MKLYVPCYMLLCTIFIMHSNMYCLAVANTRGIEVYAATSLGDLIDKILVLKIKQERIKDPLKRANIQNELQLLQNIYHTNASQADKLKELETRLLQVNKNLWDLEDKTRLKEQQECFDQEFIDLVNSVLINNDERACIKRTINLLGSSHIIEEKSYSHIKESSLETYNETNKQQNLLMVPLPLGDLVDRITILLIKKEKIQNKIKLANITTEYQILNATREKAIEPSPAFDQLFNNLYESNKQLWEIQDQLRAKKQAAQFDEQFIQLGRSVYHVNDTRCKIKKQINILCGSHLIEEKCYTHY